MVYTRAEYEAYLNSLPMKDLKLMTTSLLREIRNNLVGKNKQAYISSLLEHTIYDDESGLRLNPKTYIDIVPPGDLFYRSNISKSTGIDRKVRADKGVPKKQTAPKRPSNRNKRRDAGKPRGKRPVKLRDPDFFQGNL
jgi:hypothetical protein